jgi:hypothetical protein
MLPLPLALPLPLPLPLLLPPRTGQQFTHQIRHQEEIVAPTTSAPMPVALVMVTPVMLPAGARI